MKRDLVLALVVVGAIFFFTLTPQGRRAAQAALNSVRGVVGDDPDPDARGVVTTQPQDLLASANQTLASTGVVLTLDDYALARALRSEHGREPANVRRWVAWAIRNSAQRANNTIFRHLTRSGGPASGLFARQRTDGRFAATNEAPRGEDIQIAIDVLDSAGVEDPTRGATNFFSPRTQNILVARAQAGDHRFKGKITADANGIRARRNKQGLYSRGTPPGVEPDIVEFFGPGVAV